MVWPDGQTKRMGDDHADEPDHAADRDHGARQQRRCKKDRFLHHLDIHAKRPRGFLAHGQQIERRRLAKQHDGPGRHIDAQHQHGRIVRRRQRAHQPGHHAEGSVGLHDRGDEHHEGRKNRVENDARQQEGVDGYVPIGGGDAIDDEHRRQSPDHGAEGHGGEGQHGSREPEQDGQACAERRTAGDAQDVGIGQGIPQEGLESHADDRQAAADHEGQQHAR